MISVIIPTWNREKTISRAILSVLNQQYRDLEILICDDGSTDDTRSIVAQFAKDDSRIKWIDGKHTGGPATPRNTGINHAQGEWLAFLDSDDEWVSSKLSSQLKFAKNNQFNFVCSNAYVKRGRGSSKRLVNNYHNQTISMNNLLDGNKVICSTVLVRKKSLNKVGGFPSEKKYTAIEDYLEWLKYATYDRIGYQSAPLTTYYDSPTQTIRARWTTFAQQKEEAVKYLYRWLLEHPRLSLRYLSGLIVLIKTSRSET